MEINNVTHKKKNKLTCGSDNIKKAPKRNLTTMNEDNVDLSSKLSFSKSKKEKQLKKCKNSNIGYISQSNDESSRNHFKSSNSKKAKIKSKKQRKQNNSNSSMTTNENKLKKLKIQKKNTHKFSKFSNETKDISYHNNQDSSNSDEEQKLQNELENFHVYKKIQKFQQKSSSSSFCLEEDTSDNLVDNKTKSLKKFNSDLIKVKNKLIESESKTFTDKSPKLPSHNNKSLKPTDEVIQPIKLYQEKGILCRDHRTKIKENSFKNKAREKLQAAKFRYLNEKLYTESGKDSFIHFQNNADEFLDYHAGYSLQVSKWPMNPVDKIITSLQNLKKNSVIADMGCGDAKIARTLAKFSVVSYDLISLNKHVTACDISKVPLSNESVDVVVFCLSLMGINLKDYLREAHRIMKLGALLKIAEVESRIPDLNNFIKSIESFGFKLMNKNIEHKLFVFLDFKKIKEQVKKTQEVILKPCLYKKR